ERFAREVRVAAALQHPNVVPLFTAGEAAGLLYYVMPYVQGESMRTRLTREGRLALADALSILRDVARALAFAHEQGVVHRDVKPENVLLAGDAAVVTDFGIAKAVVAAAGDDRPGRGQSACDFRTLSAVGSTIGTPAYRSPAQDAAVRWRGHGWVPRAVLGGAGVVTVALLAYIASARRNDPSDGRAPAGAQSLAVLPFEAVGGDTANAYFGDGIADEIATALSKAGVLRVASPTSVAAFRSTHNLGVRELGRRLGVTTVLEGHVRR